MYNVKQEVQEASHHSPEFCLKIIFRGKLYSKFSFGEVYHRIYGSDSFTILGLWVLGLTVSHSNGPNANV